MESDESNLLDALATVLGLRGVPLECVGSGLFSLFFFFFGKFVFFRFLYRFKSVKMDPLLVN